MKVAIAGSGPVAKYLIEELQAAGHEIVVLTRSIKADHDYEQRQTDYTISSLVDALEDRDALISTVSVYDNPKAQIQAHLDMLEACKQSKKCKTYIPSEWTLDAENYPEQPIYFAEANKIIHEKLKAQTDLRWTIICNSWFIEYVLPSNQRHLRDVPGIWPMDYKNEVFTIYGPGTQRVEFTSVRDVARAVALLLDSDQPWDQYIHLSGEQLTWNELFAKIKKWNPEYTSQIRPMAGSLRLVTEAKSPASVLAGHFELQSYSGALAQPHDKVQEQRARYFPNLHFRTVEEVLAEGADRPGMVI